MHALARLVSLASTLAAAAAPAAHAPATGWSARCSAVLEGVRAQLGTVDPVLATAELRAEPTRHALSLSAGPPGWPTPLIVLEVQRVAAPAHDWQQRAESLAGRYHLVAARASPTATTMFSLDGWEPQKAARVTAIVEAGVLPCLAP